MKVVAGTGSSAGLAGLEQNNDSDDDISVLPWKRLSHRANILLHVSVGVG